MGTQKNIDSNRDRNSYRHIYPRNFSWNFIERIMRPCNCPVDKPCVRPLEHFVSNELTWTCHICKDERPDRKISVHKRDISAQMCLPAGTWTENVRYCNDRESCIKEISTFSFLKRNLR